MKKLLLLPTLLGGALVIYLSTEGVLKTKLALVNNKLRKISGSNCSDDLIQNDLDAEHHRETPQEMKHTIIKLKKLLHKEKVNNEGLSILLNGQENLRKNIMSSLRSILYNPRG